MTNDGGADEVPISSPASENAVRARFVARWPEQNSFRFFWRTDARHRCEQITPTLAEVVGVDNADLVGRDLAALAPLLSPKGALGAALARRATWSGIDVEWPISDAAAAVVVSMGAVAMLDGEGAFDGLRGFGIVRLDRVVPHAPGIQLSNAAGDVDETPVPNLSRDEQDRFRALAAVLREQIGEENLTTASPATERETEIGRNALALFDRLPIGLLASRNGIPIFANRFFLEFTGFADEDALHTAGGLDGLIERMPAGSDLQSIGLRTRSGTVRPVTGRIQRLDWDHLPATLLTVRSPDDLPPSATALADARELSTLRHIQEITTDGCVLLDDACRILSINRSAEALFGRDRTELIRQPFLDLFIGADRAAVADYLAGLKTSAAKALLNDGRNVAVATGQGTIPVFVSLGRLEVNEMEAGSACFCALFHDRSALSKLKRAHDDAVAAQGRMAAAFDDTVRRLQTVAMQAGALADVAIAPVASLADAGVNVTNEQAGLRSAALAIVQTLDVILHDAKLAVPRPSFSLDLNAVVRDAVAAMQPVANQSRIIVRSSLANGLPAVRLDKAKANDLLGLLLMQAIARNGPGDQVIVATARDANGGVILRLRDTGPSLVPGELMAAPEGLLRHPQANSAPAGSEPAAIGAPSLRDARLVAEEAGAAFSLHRGPDRGSIIELSLTAVERGAFGNS